MAPGSHSTLNVYVVSATVIVVFVKKKLIVGGTVGARLE